MEELRLTTELLEMAYSNGYFPMPHPETGEILWFKPNPRAILPINGFHVSRSLSRKIKKRVFNVTFDQDFKGVMEGCADREDTWITPEFKQVYHEMFQKGLAHSVEVWQEGDLVGGVYGVAMNRAFFAESKFHYVTDASKVALYYLVKMLQMASFELLEVQFLTPHLGSLGTIEVSNVRYDRLLQLALSRPPLFKRWPSQLES
jgi:leucyl/phenylalanyl-tRNA--protein transferase